MTDTVLLTGATGQLGTALLPRLVAHNGTVVLALVRGRDAAEVERRRADLVTRCGVPDHRVHAVQGDVSAPGLGLDAAARARVESEATSIVHAAAAVRFDLPADKAARSNIAATESVLELARALHQARRLKRLDHVSTAYVAGRHTGRFHEHDLDVGQQFRNTYEWSKLQSELRVRAAIAEGLPISVHRPSIVVGEAATGRTRAFNVLYWPLKIYVRGWWRTFPGRPDTRVDIVPVDWVADAITRLRRLDDTLGRTFHLAAGDDARTVRELAERIAALTGGPPVRYIDQARYRRFVRPLIWPFLSLTRRGRGILRGGEAYMPYFLGNPVFDTSSTRAALGDAGSPPPVLEYLERVVRFAVDRDFGDPG
ncbi:MAG: SDR family oxidoreductase [Deltaproteobacteria bacterium]|nr:SDR family oxidoreductase [Deltaproteobacteria bacterium]